MGHNISMETFFQFLPIILMTVFVYFIYRNYKNKNVSLDDEDAIALWKKARWGLYIIIPFICIFDIINNDIAGSKQNIVPTIVNFFLTRYIIKLMTKKGVNIGYPKLAAAGVSLVIFFCQVLIGNFIGK
jgi:hypothetical protein